MDGKHLVAGAFAGVIVVLLVLILLNQRDGQGQTGAHPQMTNYDIVRDEQGRIQSVQSVQGLPLDGQQQQQAQPQPNEPAPRQTLRN